MELYICGVCNDKYNQVHHYGEYEDVLKTYNALKNGARAAGLDEGAIVMFKHPDEDDLIKETFNKQIIEHGNFYKLI